MSRLGDHRGGIGVRQAYLDGELCGVFPDGITSFSMIQAASDAGNAAGLVFFLFDLLHLAKACELSLEGIVSKRRPWLGALLLAHYDPHGRLVYAGRAGTDINQAELGRLWRKLQPLATGCRGPAAAHQPLLARSSMWVCARTSRHLRCGAWCRIRTGNSAGAGQH